VHGEDAAFEEFDGVECVEAAADPVAGVGAGSDAWVAVLAGIEELFSW
jgi:nitrogenase subunit NifH